MKVFQLFSLRMWKRSQEMWWRVKNKHSLQPKKFQIYPSRLDSCGLINHQLKTEIQLKVYSWSRRRRYKKAKRQNNLIAAQLRFRHLLGRRLEVFEKMKSFLCYLILKISYLFLSHSHRTLFSPQAIIRTTSTLAPSSSRIN